jgi:signal transduction histidine kinase
LCFFASYIVVFVALNYIIYNILFTSEGAAAEEARRSTAVAARHKERELLLQDIHDGIGSYLATAKIRAQRESMSQQAFINTLNDCMADLYLIVDTLKDEYVNLNDALTDFRYRTDRRIHHDGLTVSWDIKLNGVPDVSQACTLQILRIAQEALTNAVRHSNARDILVQVRVLDGGVLVTVSDNGIGFVPCAKSVGQGLRNMRQRAHAIGGVLEFRKNEGTEISLLVPSASLKLHDAS